MKSTSWAPMPRSLSQRAAAASSLGQSPPRGPSCFWVPARARMKRAHTSFPANPVPRGRTPARTGLGACQPRRPALRAEAGGQRRPPPGLAPSAAPGPRPAPARTTAKPAGACSLTSWPTPSRARQASRETPPCPPTSSDPRSGPREARTPGSRSELGRRKEPTAAEGPRGGRRLRCGPEARRLPPTAAPPSRAGRERARRCPACPTPGSGGERRLSARSGPRRQAACDASRGPRGPGRAGPGPPPLGEAGPALEPALRGATLASPRRGSPRSGRRRWPGGLRSLGRAAAGAVLPAASRRSRGARRRASGGLTRKGSRVFAARSRPPAWRMSRQPGCEKHPRRALLSERFQLPAPGPQ